MKETLKLNLEAYRYVYKEGFLVMVFRYIIYESSKDSWNLGVHVGLEVALEYFENGGS